MSWAKNWTYTTDSYTVASDVRCSLDGQKVVCQHSPIYTPNSIKLSTDYGVTFEDTNSPIVYSWGALDTSDDCSVIYAIGNIDSGGLLYPHIFVSTDSGNNWTDTINTGNINPGLCCSANGQIAYFTTSEKIYKTVNYGASWAEIYSFVFDASNLITCSSDGSKIFFVRPYSGEIFVSTNSGVSWVEKSPTIDPELVGWQSICCSSNGNIIYVKGYSDNEVYISYDACNTWSTITLNELAWDTINYNYVNCSPDGSKAIISTNYYDIYVTENAGSTWTKVTPDPVNPDSAFVGSSISADGSYAYLAGKSTALIFRLGSSLTIVPQIFLMM